MVRLYQTRWVRFNDPAGLTVCGGVGWVVWLTATTFIQLTVAGLTAHCGWIKNLVGICNTCIVKVSVIIISPFLNQMS